MIDTRDESGRRLADIVNNGHRYDFFQLVSLLDRYSAKNSATAISKTQHSETRNSEKSETQISESGEPEGQGLFSEVRFRPSENDIFPASDVERVEYSGSAGDPVTIVATFHGLYGFHSPLPKHMTRDIELDVPEALPLRDFLDIFNNRLYRFFFKAWSKYRPYTAKGSVELAKVHRRFLALAGISTEKAAGGAPVTRKRLTAFAGQLGAMTRSATGLKQFIAGCMPGFEVQIEENIPRTVPIVDRAPIGRRNARSPFVLGFSSTIGQQISDISGKFRVVLGPLSFDQFESCLPGRPSAVRLEYLVSQFVTDFLAYDVELHVRTDEIPSAELGDKNRELGRNTWLRRPSGEVTSRLVQY